MQVRAGHWAAMTSNLHGVAQSVTTGVQASTTSVVDTFAGPGSLGYSEAILVALCVHVGRPACQDWRPHLLLAQACYMHFGGITHGRMVEVP
jgi:hypothetical protein